MRNENDWVEHQVALYPDRLVGFCSVNPLKDYAVAEIERCSSLAHMHGLKLHFGNSGVDVLKPEHVIKLKIIFAVANRLRLPIVVHLWTTDQNYGRAHSEVFLQELLPQAPDVVVQVAHLAGGGPGYTDEALAPLAEAVEVKDPRTRNLYFDIATVVASGQSEDVLKQTAFRFRQIGMQRLLYGTDLGGGQNPPPRVAWATLRALLPLSDVEFMAISRNVAPYLEPNKLVPGRVARPIR